MRFLGGKHKGLPIISDDDVRDLQAITQLIQVDYFILPFASCGQDIKTLREMLGPVGKTIKILAKADTINGIENFEDILNQCDGIVLCRNELSWEIPSEKLMIAQKWAIQQCNKKAKLLMIQSQVLESMVNENQPLRQEMTEISTATLEGADCFILSHETSIGKHFIDATINLAKGIAEAEAIFDYE